MTPKSINLLPPEMIRRHERQPVRVRWGLVALGAVVVSALVLALLMMFNYQLRSDLSTLRTHRTELEASVAVNEVYARLEAEVERFGQVLTAAMGRPPHWPQLLAELAKEMPDNVWLTDMVASMPHAGGTGAAPGRLSLRGYSFNHPGVAAWVEVLQDSRHLGQVSISYSQAQPYHDRTMVTFDLQVALPPGAAYAPPLAERP